MTDTISNSDDYIDSRDVIKRIEELEAELQDAYDERGEHPDDFVAYNEFLKEAPEGQDEEVDTFEGWLKFMADEATNMSDEAVELLALRSLAADAEGYAEDWRYGTTLIRESEFEDYAREFAEDCGFINRDMKWPCNHIDWKQAADELKQDYTEVDFDGVAYLVR